MTISIPFIDQGIHSLWRSFKPIPQVATPENLADLKPVSREIRHEHYQVEEVLDIRNALKFSTKLSTSERNGWGPDKSMPLCSHAAEVGFLLALSRENATTITAGLLYNALDGSDQRHNAAVSSIIKRKFGEEVLDMVVLLKHLRDTAAPLETIQNRHVASLLCAIEIARHASALSTRADANSLLAVLESTGVSNLLLSQYRAELSQAIGPVNAQAPADLWKPVEVVDIRNGLRTSVWLFKDQKRRWGPNEYLPLSAHEAEVGLLAVLAGCSRDCIIAATLHDVFEEYLPLDQNYLRQVVSRFGTRVSELVQAVTEPPKRINENGRELLDDWMQRKLSVLDRVSQGERELAELSACTKVSTLAAGNAMLYRKGSLQQWSKGPLRENIKVFISHREAFAGLGISPVLAQQFDLELERFILISAWEPDSSAQASPTEQCRAQSDAAEDLAA